MKNKFLRFERLTTWDISSLIAYSVITLYVFYISLNHVETQHQVILGYTFVTPLFLYLYNYKSLRNSTVYLIWFLFSLLQLWLHLEINNMYDPDLAKGYSEGLNYIWIFMLYFQFARIAHLAIKKIELVAPAYFSSIDIHDNRKIEFWDYLFGFIFLIIWVIIIPTMEH